MNILIYNMSILAQGGVGIQKHFKILKIWCGLTGSEAVEGCGTITYMTRGNVLYETERASGGV